MNMHACMYGHMSVISFMFSCVIFVSFITSTCDYVLYSSLVTNLFSFSYTIQRLGCLQDNGEQKPGCGGFGKVLPHDRFHFFSQLGFSCNTQNLFLNAIFYDILLRSVLHYF